MKNLLLILSALLVSFISRSQTIVGPDSLCVGAGASYVFTYGGSGGGGTWSMSGTGPIEWGGATDSVFGIGVGTATLTYTTGSGYHFTKSIAVYSACSGTPSPSTIAASSATFCYPDDVRLSIASGSTDCGVLHQWEESLDSLHWSPSGYFRTFELSPVAETYYRNIATCLSNGLSSISNVIHLRPDSFRINSHVCYEIPDTICVSTVFLVFTCGATPLGKLVTKYGDGHSDTALFAGTYEAETQHRYTIPGTYTVKQILYDGTLAVDSVLFPYTFTTCHGLSVQFYNDANSNCNFDSGESYMREPITVEIDSDGVALDTITALSGVWKAAYGPPGTVYAFKVLSSVGEFYPDCPTSGIIYDTIAATGMTYPTKYIGFNCGSTTHFDLSVYGSLNCHPGFADAYIEAVNPYCTPVNAIVKMVVDSQYIFDHASPAPTSTSGDTLIWSCDSLSFSRNAGIYAHFIYRYSLLHLGTLVSSFLKVTPLAGDIDSLNNKLDLTSNVRGSYDPNEISVSPSGKIIPCTPLRYTIKFENTGNDTAHNIAVIDTLPAGVDARTVKVVAASGVMNLAILRDGAIPVIKFDFPNINLLDSSHHNECEGMVVFEVATKPGLADGSTIANRAGIYFDDNPVVMTNSVSNVSGIGDILPANDSICVGASALLYNETPGGIWTFSNAIASISGAGVLTAVSSGTGIISYTASNSCGSKTTTTSLSVDSIYMPVVQIELKQGGLHRDTLIAYATHAGHLPGYQWYVNHTMIAGATNALFSGYSFANGDSVSCVVTAQGTCGYPSFNGVIIHTSPSGVHYISPGGQPAFQLWPNPADNNITVSCIGAGRIILYDIQGRLLKTCELVAGSNSVSLTDLRPGIYTCKYADNEGLSTPAVVKLLIAR